MRGPASACGITAGGTAGITSCSLEEHEEAIRRKWHLGSSYSFSSTGLRVRGGPAVRARTPRLAGDAGVPASRRATSCWGRAVSWAATSAPTPPQSDFEPGFVGVAGGAWRVLEGGRQGPFLLLTGQLSYAWARNQGAAYNAIDVRAGAVVATTLWRMLTPYVLTRVFGGPVYWR